jgi:1-acyl-sn-glycerol-3-phosphate acyltransferase
MGNLPLSANDSHPRTHRTGDSDASRFARLSRGVRSAVFFFVYLAYMAVAIGLGQRLLLWPAMVLAPGRRRALVRGWLRFHSRAPFALARMLANVRVTIRGAIEPWSCIVVMNHQSVLDIPLGLMLVPGPYPLIPTRDRYRRGVPGISPLARLARFPFVTQRRVATRSEVIALTGAADQVARGEQSLLIFPEGHRTRTGQIGRFMRNGLRLALERARRPVYCVVADGMWHARTFAEALLTFADSQIRVVILGPFPPPATDSIEQFIDQLHQRMTITLDQLRTTPTTPSPVATDPITAG